MSATFDDETMTAQALRLAPSGVVKAWLQDALTGYFPTEDVCAFVPFEAFIGRGYFLADDLAEIYASVPAGNARAWRTAMADLLAELPASRDNADALDTLIDCARFIAAYEVLTRAGNRIRDDDFAGLRVKSGETLLERALRMAIELATDTTGLSDFFIEALQSQYFPVHLSLQTFAALARSDPEHWIAHLGVMRPFIAEMIRRHRPSAEGMRRQTQDLVDAVGLRRILEELHNLRRAPHWADEEEAAGYDEWLASELLFGTNSIVENVVDPFFPKPGPGHLFSPRKNPKVRIFIPRSRMEDLATSPDKTRVDPDAARRRLDYLDRRGLEPEVSKIAVQGYRRLFELTS